MANPYAAFSVSDDEDDAKVNVVKAEDKPKRTHQEKKNYKKQMEQSQKSATTTAVQAAETALIGHNLKTPYPHTERQKKNWIHKELTDGHTHDRRSGTGREDRPRKAGGGYGNVGNAKDEINQDKYVKEGKENQEVKKEEETTELPVETKPVSPPKLTLDEYYKSKGVDITYNVETKAAVKKAEINADWIKKEKLTLIETKEDKKQQEKKNGQQTIKQTAVKGLDVAEDQQNILGFGSKPNQNKQDDRRGEKRDHKGKHGKPYFAAEDFPTL